MRSSLHLAFAAAALAALAGCRAASPDPAPADTSGAAAAPSPAAPSTSASPPDVPATEPDTARAPSEAPNGAPGDETAAFSGTTGRTVRAGPPAAPGLPLVRAVRTATHAGFDRIVFEFGGSAGRTATVPGYRIGYEASPTRCGSGDAVAVDGAALVVEMQPAAAHTDAGQPTLSVRRLTPRHASVRTLEQTCDFEALVVWTVSVAARRPYRVRELAAPARLVVDVAHTER